MEVRVGGLILLEQAQSQTRHHTQTDTGLLQRQRRRLQATRAIMSFTVSSKSFSLPQPVTGQGTHTNLSSISNPVREACMKNGNKSNGWDHREREEQTN